MVSRQVLFIENMQKATIQYAILDKSIKQIENYPLNEAIWNRALKKMANECPDLLNYWEGIWPLADRMEKIAHVSLENGQRRNAADALHVISWILEAKSDLPETLKLALDYEKKTYKIYDENEMRGMADILIDKTCTESGNFAKLPKPIEFEHLVNLRKAMRYYLHAREYEKADNAIWTLGYAVAHYRQNKSIEYIQNDIEWIGTLLQINEQAPILPEILANFVGSQEMKTGTKTTTEDLTSLN